MTTTILTLDGLAFAAALGMLGAIRWRVRRYYVGLACPVLGACAAVLDHRPSLLAADIALLAFTLVGLGIDVRARAELRARALIDHLDAHPEGSYGLDLCEALRVGPRTLYPLLARLQDDGTVCSWWGPRPVDGRPRRRLYGLTAAEA